MREVDFRLANYTEPFTQFDFLRYLWNSVFVTAAATVITLPSPTRWRPSPCRNTVPGRDGVMLTIVATLMVPLSVILVPLYSIVSAMGLFNSLWA